VDGVVHSGLRNSVRAFSTRTEELREDHILVVRTINMSTCTLITKVNIQESEMSYFMLERSKSKRNMHTLV
jgi:cell division protein ZapA (FtsZ GTPase activity inhibitor)